MLKPENTLPHPHLPLLTLTILGTIVLVMLAKKSKARKHLLLP
jgi:hypothetical protein